MAKKKQEEKHVTEHLDKDPNDPRREELVKEAEKVSKENEKLVKEKGI